MKDKKFCDWSHLYKTGSIERPEHLLSKPLKLKKGIRGSDATDQQFSELENNIIGETPRQPTDEEMFGHLVVTEEQVQKAKHAWETKIQAGYGAAARPVDPHHADRSWGNCTSFKDSLTPEELKKYREDCDEFDKKG